MMSDAVTPKNFASGVARSWFTCANFALPEIITIPMWNPHGSPSLQMYTGTLSSSLARLMNLLVARAA